VNRGFPVMSIDAHVNLASTEMRTSRVVESNVRRSAVPLVGAHGNLASTDSMKSPLAKVTMSDATVKRSPAGTQKRGRFDAHVNLASTDTTTSRVVESNVRLGATVPLIGARGNLASTDSMKSPLAEANVSDAMVKRVPRARRNAGLSTLTSTWRQRTRRTTRSPTVMATWRQRTPASTWELQRKCLILLVARAGFEPATFGL
jgi:hypothetical protein